MAIIRGNISTNETKSNNTICSTNFHYSSPSQEYWDRKVLNITDSLGESGSIRYELVVCLILAWTLVFLCLIKGIKSSGKVCKLILHF